MWHLSVWVIEFFKLVGRRRIHPLVTQCSVCQQMVRLHVNKAGRRYVFAHARQLYEGSRWLLSASRKPKSHNHCAEG
jgi:hypothetical protein